MTDRRNDDHEAWFRMQLLRWWKTNRRDFPWRRTRDPYRVLVAELMLRRTQARQVVPVYERFLELFPSVPALARADEDEVANVLFPLGLAWRVAAFRAAAQRIEAVHDGEVPDDRAALLALPGVGDYVADAVRCFAFGEAVALVDTNTVRLSGRFLGFPHAGDVRRLGAVRRAIAALVGGDGSKSLNLAMIDHAALVCSTPRPRCSECPLSERCAFLLTAGTSPK